MIPRVLLKEGREKSLRQRHPWVFSGAVAQVEGAAVNGGIVDLCAADGAFLARACWNSNSQIVARVCSWLPEPIDCAFFTRRIAESAARRAGLSRGGASARMTSPPPPNPPEGARGTGSLLTPGVAECAGETGDGVSATRNAPADSATLRLNVNRGSATLQRGLRGGGEVILANGIPPTSAFRVVNGEADLLPGLIVDRYGEFLVLQVLTLAMAQRLPELVEIFVELFQPRGIWQRSDVEIRRKEGLEPETGLLYGEEPPPLLEICENGVRLLVDLRGGQKTGFFLDQRDNRRIVGEFLKNYELRITNGESESPLFTGTSPVVGGADAVPFDIRNSQFAIPPRPLELLNAFSYSAGFGVYAAHAVPGCRVTNLDASAGALALAKANAELNGVPEGQWEYLEGDAFKVLRTFRDSRRTFDAIVLDPPKFAQSKSQVEGACRGYKDLNLLAIKMLRPGGLLFTFSCSGGVSPELFQKVVAGAAADAGRAAQVLAHLGPGSDHPVLLSFPEGEYLKGLVIRCL